jgi:DNA-binding HxlR family transcriptional regulator
VSPIPTLTAAQRREAARAEYDAFLAACPSRQVLARISDKWVTLVLCALAEGPQRYSDLGRVIAGVSQKMLTQTLRTLERDGLVVRTVTASVPVRVDYQLTPLGEGLMRAVNAVKAWAEDHIGEIEASRAAYDARGERPSTAAGGNLGWVAGRLGDVGPAGRGGPPEGARANLLGLPAGVLLEPVVVTALRAAVAHARPAARLVLDAVLEIAPAGRAAAGGSGADIRCG